MPRGQVGTACLGREGSKRETSPHPQLPVGLRKAAGGSGTKQCFWGGGEGLPCGRESGHDIHVPHVGRHQHDKKLFGSVVSGSLQDTSLPPPGFPSSHT